MFLLEIHSIITAELVCDVLNTLLLRDSCLANVTGAWTGIENASLQRSRQTRTVKIEGMVRIEWQRAAIPFHQMYCA